MVKLVLLRHGQSVWNKENRFSGWSDVPLSTLGKKEAKDAGKILKKENYTFDIAFSSVLKRAIETLDLTLSQMNLKIPVKKNWRLNERHYGGLQGLHKDEMARLAGEKQVFIWRRSYTTRPPTLNEVDIRHPKHDKMYKNVSKSDLPASECLKDTVKRVLVCWKKDIVPLLKKDKKVIISAHGNSLRALVKYLDKISDDNISSLNIPTGIPLVYELDKNLKPIKHYYLGDQEKIKNMINKVKKQGKK
jgi:2,3-bisphosphoglycerate-dependent phosphoglycerate mutase